MSAEASPHVAWSPTSGRRSQLPEGMGFRLAARGPALGAVHLSRRRCCTARRRWRPLLGPAAAAQPAARPSCQRRRCRAAQSPRGPRFGRRRLAALAAFCATPATPRTPLTHKAGVLTTFRDLFVGAATSGECRLATSHIISSKYCMNKPRLQTRDNGSIVLWKAPHFQRTVGSTPAVLQIHHMSNS
jgi:hypothetical protein